MARFIKKNKAIIKPRYCFETPAAFTDHALQTIDKKVYEQNVPNAAPSIPNLGMSKIFNKTFNTAERTVELAINEVLFRTVSS